MNHKEEVLNYVQNVLNGEKIACEEIKLACKRFQEILDDESIIKKWDVVESMVSIIEKIFKHIKGEDIKGNGLAGKNLKLEPWQKFILANLTGLYTKDGIRLYTEAFIFLGRKNAKTTFIACLAFVLALLYIKSGSVIYIAAATLQQSLESFNYLVKNLENLQGVKIQNNNHGREIRLKIGSDEVIIRATVPKDGLNGNVMIIDEMHAITKEDHYGLMADATKAYRNKLVLGITTAGLNRYSFNFHHMEKQRRMLRGEIKDNRSFAFIAKAEENEKGEIDLLDPKNHEKANPNYGVSIDPEAMMKEARDALENPLAKANFIAKSLNCYVQGASNYFDVDEIIKSDAENNYSLKDLLKKKLVWYGGADLSKFHDLTAAALVAKDGDKLIVYSHGFFPLERALAKQSGKNAVPMFGWGQDGFVTLSDTAVVNVNDICQWFIDRRNEGFNIKQIGFDRKFSQEFYKLMKMNGFKMIEENQTALNKSQGFREIERAIKSKNFSYLGNKLYEFCISNVSAVEGVDDVVKYEKSSANAHIDLFDASVFATTRLLQDIKKKVNLDEIIKLQKGVNRGNF